VGGSGARYVVWDGERVVSKGPLRWRPGDALEGLRKELERLKGRYGIRKVGVAMRGVWTEDEREEVRRSLGVDGVLSDVEGVFYDAFVRDGMVVVAGTGSICYGVREGRRARFGGFGPIVDDWGSAFWMGRLAVEISLKKESFLRMALFSTEDLEEIRNILAALQRRRLPEIVEEIAGYARVVLEAAELGDEDALFVVRAAVRELVAMCLKVMEEIGNPRSVALHGGLFRSSLFRREFVALLRRYAIGEFLEETDGARGVAKWLSRR